MSVPDNSYSIRMRRLKQKQDAFYANNTIGSQLSRPFNTNISPTGNMGNQFMLGTVAGSKNEVNTSPYGRVNHDIACTCTGAAEEVAAAPSPPPEQVIPNITYMIPGSVYGFAFGNISNNKGSVGFKLDTSETPPFAWQPSYNELAPTFEAYLMEFNGLNRLYVAGYDNPSENTTYLLVINPTTGEIIKKITYANKTILGINEIYNGFNSYLYVTYCEINTTALTVNSYIDLYNLSDPDPFLSPVGIRTYNNTFIRGKIIYDGSKYYSIVYTNVTVGENVTTYDIDMWSWSIAVLADLFKTTISLFTACSKSTLDFSDPKLIISSPQVIGALSLVIMIECVNGLDTGSLPVNGLTLYGFEIGVSGPLAPAILDGGSLLSTINVSNSIFILTTEPATAYVYVIAGTTTSRIYGYDIGRGGPITPSAATNYTVTNTQFTTDGTALYRFEFDGTNYRVAKYAATTNLAVDPISTLALPQYGGTPVIPNIVWDGTNMYVNTGPGEISQLDTNLTPQGTPNILTSI